MYSFRNLLYTVRIITRDSTQMNREPSRVTAHRGMLSRKPTSSIIATISSGSSAAADPAMPEEDRMVSTIPWATRNRAVMSSMP